MVRLVKIQNLFLMRFGRIIDGFQGESLGKDSIAMTTKHFPGGGARENGFDPHYEEGKWNLISNSRKLRKVSLTTI